MASWRVGGILLALALLLAPLAARGQAAGRVYRVGLLVRGTPGPSANVEAFRQGMRQLGYEEGRNVLLEYRYDEGREERLLALATDLVRARVDVVVTWGSQAIRAAQEATRETPIVIAYTSDPVGSGLVTSLAHPGGNVTGLSAMGTELASKRLGLLREILPGASRVAVLSHRGDQASLAQVRALQLAARSLTVTLRTWEVDRPDQLPGAFAAMGGERMAALVVVHSTFTAGQESLILSLAARHGMPAIYQLRRWAEAGGLVAYGPNQADMSRRAAGYVDRILKGARPGDLPIEQPTAFELVVNLRTARALGLTFPSSVLGAADEIIQ